MLSQRVTRHVKQNPYLPFGAHPEISPSYLMFLDTTDGLIKAKNGLTGIIDFQSAYGGIVFQWALNAVNASGVRGTIVLKGGTYDGSAQIDAKSNVDVYAVGATFNITINGAGDGLHFNNVTNSIWEGINIVRKGTLGAGVSAKALYIEGNTDNTCVLKHCKFINEADGVYAGEGLLCGIWIGQLCSPSPILEYCLGQGSLNATSGYLNPGIDIHILQNPTTGTLGAPKLIGCTGIGGAKPAGRGFDITEADAAELIDCVGIGSTGDGITINDASPTLKNCKGIAGTQNGATGIMLWTGGSPILMDCEAISGKYDHTSALIINDSNSAIVDHCFGHPPIEGHQWYYDAANNGRFRPFAGFAYIIRNISLWVSIPQPGVTLNIGTSIGGNELAAAISLAVGGTVPFNWTSRLLAAGGYMYATPSAGIPNNSIFLYYTVMYAVSDCRGIAMATLGVARVSNSHFMACDTDGFGMPIRIGPPAIANKNWRIDNSVFESLSIGGGCAIYSDAAITDVPIYNSTFKGAFSQNITSFVRKSKNFTEPFFVYQNDGTSTGTNAQQTIAHGCNFTPTYDQVFLSERSTGLAVPYQSAAPDAINIYVTAVLNKTYNWRVSYDP